MKKTVLIVDDENGITEAIGDVLTDEGFAILVARNGKDGLRLAAEKHPDVVLLDYMMPIMDGREMLKALQADEALRHTPVILMSAMQRGSLPSDCLPTRFLRKPFSLDVLLDELAQLGLVPSAS